METNINKVTQPPKRIKTSHNYTENEETCRPVFTQEYDQQNSPLDSLHRQAIEWQCSLYDEQFSLRMDQQDPFSHFRKQFHYPKCADLPKVDSSLVDREECIYFCGNSLGLQPKTTAEWLQRQMDKWAAMGVEGHFTGELPWAGCDDCLLDDMAPLIGARPEEVAIMNALTINLHLLMISFYEPTKTRHKILLESKAFPSDHYAVESQIRLRGFDPETSMLCLEPRQGEHILRSEDIQATIEEEGDSIAVVLLPGVQYYTGQLFDMQTITKAAQKKGCIVGWDLAHAVGNVPIYLHDWQVDFACWCSYKYMNSGPGGIGGAFIHDKHSKSARFRLTGWWSHKRSTRFDMSNEMEMSEGISGYRISNPSMFLCAALAASLQVFKQTTVEKLRTKSLLLTSYLEALLKHHYPKPEIRKTRKDQPFVDIITPEDPAQRGCQLSVMFSVPTTDVFHALTKRGVLLDHRKPNVLRLAPVHLYNTFNEVYHFVKILGEAMAEAHQNNNKSSPEK